MVAARFNADCSVSALTSMAGAGGGNDGVISLALLRALAHAVDALGHDCYVLR